MLKESQTEPDKILTRVGHYREDFQVTTHEQVERLLGALDRTVDRVLAYFEGPGSASETRIGDWGAWEILCHFVFWHEATAEGMASVARGGVPKQLDADTDELNARVIAAHQGQSFLDLTAHLRELHGQLQQAARSLPDLDLPVIVLIDGRTLSGRQRLEMMNRHWDEHLTELQNA